MDVEFKEEGPEYQNKEDAECPEEDAQCQKEKSECHSTENLEHQNMETAEQTLKVQYVLHIGKTVLDCQ